MIERWRAYCERHKFLFVLAATAVFYVVMFVYGRVIKAHFPEHGAFIFWPTFFALLFPYLLFLKWFARIHHDDVPGLDRRPPPE